GQRRPCESDSIPHEQGLVGGKHQLGLPASLGKQKTTMSNGFHRSWPCCELRISANQSFNLD
ncbi:hypothetical protein LOC71_18760, partial [Rhodopirellula sp. JC740]